MIVTGSLLTYVEYVSNAVGVAVRKSHGLTPAIVVVEGRGEGAE